MHASPQVLKSIVYRNVQCTLLQTVADAFGWDAQFRDAQWYPPPKLQKAFTALWRDDVHDWGPHLAPSTTRAKVERQIFSETLARDKQNPRVVRRHDPAIMRLVDGMMDEYGLCLHWELLAYRDYRQSTPTDRASYQAKIEAIEAVRGMVAAHYVHELLEKGYTVSEATKVVGNAISGYLMVATGYRVRNEVAGISVAPAKADTPQHTLMAIDAHARIHTDRLGINM